MGMKRTSGMWYGTGTAIFICCGFVPDWVWAWNIELATYAQMFWCNQFRTADAQGGMQWSAADSAQVDITTLDGGIRGYFGGDVMNSTIQPSVTLQSADVDFFMHDDKDYRYYTNNAAGISGDAVTETIDTWTSTTASTSKGKFNSDVTGTYIGEGSPIIIENYSSGKQYHGIITALTATQGSADDEVTIYPTKGDRVTGIPSGKVTYIGYKDGYKPIPLGDTAPAGFRIGNTTVNVAADRCFFEAGTYDDTSR